MKNTLISSMLAGALALAGCATPLPSDIPASARPDAPPVAAVTRFEAPLDCMDNAFAEYGISGVTIAVSAVPDYTGRAYVGSSDFLMGAIAKMSQRSGAFVITDYNPNQLAPEQGLWVLSTKDDFYIPAFYIRGAISGFAGNVAERSGTIGAGTPTDGASLTSGSAFSLVSVDLSIGNLQQRTMINRARAANEVVLKSQASGGQLSGLLGGAMEKYGANFEIVASQAEGLPQAVRTLLELNAIETLGRLTGVPYWSCLGIDHGAFQAEDIRQDIFFNMSPPERTLFVQRRLMRLGLYGGPLNGVNNPELDGAIAVYLEGQGLSPQTSDFGLYRALTDWKDPVILSFQTDPPRQIQASQPVPEQVQSLSQGLSVQINLLAAHRAPNEPLNLSMRSSQTAYAYCYLQDLTGAVSRVFPNRWQPDPIVPEGKDVTVPGLGAGFDLLFPPEGGREELVCFVSSLELGARLPDRLKVRDLEPLPVPSLDILTGEYNTLARQNGAEIRVERFDLSVE